MKKTTFYCSFLFLFFIISCTEKVSKSSADTHKKLNRVLPFSSVDLSNLDDFKAVTDNWQIVGNAFVDRNKERTLVPSSGTGVLVNLPKEGKKEHLFTTFEHGDIEVEVDVMMPVASNSGLYFQGRYEVQLFDSWGIKKPKYSDIGGIYQRRDDAKEEGEKEYEGHSPRINAGKAPGLWQHFKIIFHSPKFNAAGEKVKNALFKEVWLNGQLIQENIEVTGPTIEAAFNDEQAKGPFMIQGDHGPVAIKNLRYKLYKDEKVTLKDVVMTDYDNSEKFLPSLDSLVSNKVIKVDSISSKMIADKYVQKILKYSGNLDVPVTGDYIFELKVNGGAVFLIGKDTIANLDGDYDMFNPKIANISLEKGETPFTLIYNKHTPWMRGFSLEVEGPGLEKHSLQAKGSINLNEEKPDEDIVIKVLDQTETQRSFLMHEGKKRTHVISVGLKDSIHYAYDLGLGSLLQVWEGDFLNVSDMWHSRGIHQLASPMGFVVSIHGDMDFTVLENENTSWSKTIPEEINYKQIGYEFNENDIPVFLHQINGTTITNTFIPAATGRALVRNIRVKGEQEIWHKIAEGTVIEALSDGTYIINDESYFIDFSGNKTLKPVVRKIGKNDELLVKIPAGSQEFNYSLIW